MVWLTGMCGPPAEELCYGPCAWDGQSISGDAHGVAEHRTRHIFRVNGVIRNRSREPRVEDGFVHVNLLQGTGVHQLAVLKYTIGLTN